MPGYRTWATGDVPSAADFNNLHADPQQADVATSQTTTSLTYTDLATSGPAVTETLVTGQKVLVIVSARTKHSAAGGQSALFSYAVSGASTLSAQDVNGAETADTTTGGATLTKASVFTATGTGSTIFTMKYQVQAGGTGTYFNRRIITKKF
jgi:hypothetical protein